MVKKTLELPRMRGIQDLLSINMDVESPTTTISIDKIRLPAKQARRYFDVEKLNHLAQSIQEHGILQPLLVRPFSGVSGEYELVAGERRLRAAQIIGLKEVPIISKDLSDIQRSQITLLENLQREDLSPLEETEGILELLGIQLDVAPSDIISILNQAANNKRRNLELTENVFRQIETIEKVFSTIGKFSAESFRTSRLPLLNLPGDLLDVLRQGKLEYTKARVIAQVKDEGKRNELINKAISDNLSLNEIKQLLKISKSAETTIEETLRTRYTGIAKRLKNTKVWEDVKKTKKLEKLLKDLEELLD